MFQPKRMFIVADEQFENDDIIYTPIMQFQQGLQFHLLMSKKKEYKWMQEEFDKQDKKKVKGLLVFKKDGSWCWAESDDDNKNCMIRIMGRGGGNATGGNGGTPPP
jgi:hypothetical protein